MRQARRLATWGVLCVGLLAAAGCGEEPEEVARRVFESRVSEAFVNVERDEVHVFGSDQTKGVVIDRWTQRGGAYRELREEQTGARVDVVSSCTEPGGCRARYDLSLPKSAEVEVTMEEGHLGVYHLGGGVRATVGRGSIVGKHLMARHVELDLGSGDIDVIMADRPQLLIVRLEEGHARLVMPPGRYRCEFDRFDEAVTLGELDCHGMISQGIRLELGKDAEVTFKLNNDYQGPTP